MNWLKSSVPTQLSDFTLICVKDFHTFISTLCWHGAMVSSKTRGVSRASSASGNSHCRQTHCSSLSAFVPLLLWDMLDLAEPIQSALCEKAILLPHPQVFKNIFFWLVFYWFSDMDHQHSSTHCKTIQCCKHMQWPSFALYKHFI